MESITIYPKNEKQKSLLKSLLEELKVHFVMAEKNDETLLSEDEFYRKIDKSIKQAEAGKTKILSKDKQKEYNQKYNNPQKILFRILLMLLRTSYLLEYVFVIYFHKLL